MLRSFFHFLIRTTLYFEAKLYRSRCNGPVVAITGSVGKTGTKEAIGTMLRKFFGQDIIVTPKSLNTEIGVPLTMLGFQSIPASFFGWPGVILRGMVVAVFGAGPKCMVLELGSDKKGDIAYLASLVRPTHAVITNISESHSQFLGSLDDIIKEKLALLQFVHLDGWIVMNGDDTILAKQSVAPTQKKILVRLHRHADYFASGIKLTSAGTAAVLHYHDRTMKVHINRFGEHQLYSVLFAKAIGDALSVPESVQRTALREIQPVPGRGMLIAGKHGSFILDESYNAQPAAMKASLELLSQFPAKKRIAILGDMRELRDPEPVHRAIGKLAKQSADYVIAVGPLSKAYNADVWHLTADEAVQDALRQLQPGAIVLVKGSQNTIRLERLVKSLMASPNQAKSLLVRQEESWLHKP